MGGDHTKFYAKYIQIFISIIITFKGEISLEIGRIWSLLQHTFHATISHPSSNTIQVTIHVFELGSVTVMVASLIDPSGKPLKVALSRNKTKD